MKQNFHLQNLKGVIAINLIEELKEQMDICKNTDKYICYVFVNSKTPIHTYCTGYAMSAAFQIFLSGHKRFCTKHTTFMYHQMSCKRQGKYQDLVEDRVQMDYLQKTIEEYVIERTKLSQADIDDIREKKKDFYIHPEDALKWGIVDEII